jgi:hypothetical protein
MLASALLHSLSSLVPKVSREVCVRFRLFVCDPRSCDLDIGRVILIKNFYQLLFTPPLYGRQSGPSNIDFKPHTAIKSQALVDFMAEWLENQLPTPTE